MKLTDLHEAPYLHNEYLPYKNLGKISINQLNREWKLLIKIENLGIYYNNTGFLAGTIIDSDFYYYVSISAVSEAEPVVPTQLGTYMQVMMVNVSEQYAQRGNAKLVYNQIAKHVSLVSDYEQYRAARDLWNSLARDSDINVYVFNGNINDYIRDNHGNIIKYNGSNIPMEDIWGNDKTHHLVLLVATNKILK